METSSLPPEEQLTLWERFLVTQKVCRLAVADVISSCRDAIFPTGIERGEGLMAYLGRRAETRKEADEASLRDYILEKEIGSVASRHVIEQGYTKVFEF